MREPAWLWVVVFGVVICLIVADAQLFSRHRRGMPPREALALSILWIVLAGLFGLGVLVLAGGGPAEEYFTAYLVEKGLALDSVFTFALIFTALAVPRQYEHRVLLDVRTIVVVLASRVALVVAGLEFLDNVRWSVYVLGGLLLIVGAKMLGSAAPDPERSFSIRVLRRFLPVTPDYHDGSFLVRIGGRLHSTPLLLALVAVEVSELVFSIDSVPAVLGVTDKAFLVFSAVAFSLLGLRSLYFVLAGAIPRYKYLRLGVSVLVILVGLKLVLSHVAHVPLWLSLSVAATVLVVSVAASIRFPLQAARVSALEPPAP